MSIIGFFRRFLGLERNEPPEDNLPPVDIEYIEGQLVYCKDIGVVYKVLEFDPMDRTYLCVPTNEPDAEPYWIPEVDLEDPIQGGRKRDLCRRSGWGSNRDQFLWEEGHEKPNNRN